MRLNYSGSDTIGREIMRGQSAVQSMTNAQIILQNLGNERYHVLTAFPE